MEAKKGYPRKSPNGDSLGSIYEINYYSFRLSRLADEDQYAGWNGCYWI